jgi:hypothetical protein
LGSGVSPAKVAVSGRPRHFSRKGIKRGVTAREGGHR